MLKDLAASFLFPTEISAMLKLKFGGYVRKMPSEPLDELATTLNDLDFCYATLNKVSRSFAVVIQQLPENLKDPVCIFYLVLRGLDSVEDDMTFNNKEKIPLLREFYNKLLIDNWSIKDVGDAPDYRILLANFGKVINVFKSLDVKYQSVILDITRRMGAGMAEYVNKIGSIDTVPSYNLYCHYVAGLVGHGLSRLFSQSGLESADLQTQERISNSMGLFLQKTNIIRDYLEDLQAGRTWWPTEIWSQYGSDLSVFASQPHSDSSLDCLNHMVLDSLSHVPDVLDYLGRLKDRKIFEFCAIPQVMAIATLSDVFNNPAVFQSVVKIRKGLSCKLMLESSNLYQVHAWFNLFADQIANKIPNKSDPNTERIRVLIQQTKSTCKLSSNSLTNSNAALLQQNKLSSSKLMRSCNITAWILFFTALIYILIRLKSRSAVNNEDPEGNPQLLGNSGWLMRPGSGLDLAAVLTCFAAVGYLFGFFGIQYV